MEGIEGLRERGKGSELDGDLERCAPGQAMYFNIL